MYERMIMYDKKKCMMLRKSKKDEQVQNFERCVVHLYRKYLKYFNHRFSATKMAKNGSHIDVINDLYYMEVERKKEIVMSDSINYIRKKLQQQSWWMITKYLRINYNSNTSVITSEPAKVVITVIIDKMLQWSHWFLGFYFVFILHAVSTWVVLLLCVLHWAITSL